MNINEITSVFKDNMLLCVSSYILGILLVYPKYSIVSIGIQLVFLNVYVYWFHRLLHILPEYNMNFHIHWHHNKNLDIPKNVELLLEFFTNMSWFVYLILFQWLFNIEYLSTTLILFIGLWYSSIHTINFSVFNSNQHIIHHIERTYNYGPPCIDVLFGTFKEPEEKINSYEFVNGFFIFLALFYIKPKFTL